jgi:hypothetical protein
LQEKIVQLISALNDQQLLQRNETEQLYVAYLHAKTNVLSHRYGMAWKKSNGGEYLFRYSDARGNGKSLGPRNEETEKIYAGFCAGKARAEESFSGISARLREQARLNKAVRINRVPTEAWNLLNEMGAHQFSRSFRVIGSNALFAYEAMAGVHLESRMMSTRDYDILFDSRKSVSLVAHGVTDGGIMGILQQVDKSYSRMNGQTFRAANKDGFMVDLVSPIQPLSAPKNLSLSPPDDLVPVEIMGLQWLCNAPAVTATVIGMNGFPVSINVPDPRAFALHKFWISENPDREPTKRPRDKAQANAILNLIRAYLPQFPLDSHVMKYLPKDVLEKYLLTNNKDLS